MIEKVEKILTEGLTQGFAGGTEMSRVERGGFNFKSSHLATEDAIYHDEWFADRAGGGQEIVRTEETTYTRVYAGGTVLPERLLELGISISEVMNFLKKQILQNGKKIRLETNFEPEREGDWQYSYTVVDKDPVIPLTIGKEVIRFKDNLVFVHDFIISPVD